MFLYEWKVAFESNRELSEDAVNVIEEMKEEFADAIERVIDIEGSFVELDELGYQIEAEKTNSDRQDEAHETSDDLAGQTVPVNYSDWF